MSQKPPAWDFKFAQHYLEKKLGMTAEERIWIMSHASFPSVRYFWTAYKRACNFLYDTDKFINVQKHFKFIRTLIKSGLNYNDPRYKIVDDGKTYTPPQIIL